MDVKQLRYFLEIIEQGSISRAASRLGVAQPALSIHLRNMEAELGTHLLTRHRSGVQPTEAGLLLARHARFVLSEQSKALDDIRQLGKEPAGVVRLGLPGTISDVLTVPLIEAMAQRFPRIRLKISEGMSGFVSGWLREGEIDLAVLYFRPEGTAVESSRILEEELVAFGAAGALPAPLVTLTELAQKPLILPMPAHGLRKLLDLAAQEAGVAITPAIEIDSYNNIKSLVAKGLGISILPHHAISAEERAQNLSVARISPALKRSVWLVTRSSAPSSRVVQITRQMLEEVTDELIAKGAWIAVKRMTE